MTPVWLVTQLFSTAIAYNGHVFECVSIYVSVSSISMFRHYGAGLYVLPVYTIAAYIIKINEINGINNW